MSRSRVVCLTLLSTLLIATNCTPANSEQPAKGASRQVDLGGDVTLEVVYIPPGKFMMGSTPEERAWATGIEGGAQPGTARETYEGEARPMQVKDGFWMGRTEVSVGQFKRFVEETGYVTDAEKPGGKTQCLDLEWTGYQLAVKVVHPWKPMEDKSWRDPNFGIPQRDCYPVVCVSYNDMKAFCQWLTEKESAAGRLPKGLQYRLPTEAEWAYACRGGRQDSSFFWWGNILDDGEGRLNISAVDFLPGRTRVWPLANAPWSDGFAFLSPVDHYGQKGRNGFGLADMCGGVWNSSSTTSTPRAATRKSTTKTQNSAPSHAPSAAAATTSTSPATPAAPFDWESKASPIPTPATASGSASACPAPPNPNPARCLLPAG